ncbi:hypothetical protein [Nesterenkonia sp.]|uniref:hypothetical protein n=1 Tax=Nesterenkonia sp. TaxID=704201 RepID=UPI00260CA812|nr:hypothetical protein [Nesterenkonia sp.]
MVLVPADIEYVVNSWLRDQYQSHGWGQIPVSTRLPRAEDTFVVAFTTGGTNRTLVSGEDRIVFDCYAPREALAQKVSARIFALVTDLDCRRVGDVQFYDVTPTKPANYPNPEKPNLYRYQFNALIHARYLTGA